MGHPERPVPESSKDAYDRLTGYGFARRYVGGKIVADIGREEVGYGSRLLAETAESVTVLIGSPEAVERASAAHPAPNVSYRRRTSRSYRTPKTTSTSWWPSGWSRTWSVRKTWWWKPGGS